MNYAGKNIDLLLEKWGWSRDKLGEKAGMGRGAVASYAQGKANPNPEFLFMLERMTGIGMSRWLFTELAKADFPEQPLDGWRKAGPLQLQVMREPEPPAYGKQDGPDLAAELERIKQLLKEMEKRLSELEKKGKKK